MSRRTERLNALLRSELSDLIAREVKDPRLGGVVSITHVDVTPDLQRARVLISTLGDESEQSDVMRALKSAAPFLRRELMRRLSLKHVPELAFRQDDSIKRGADLAQIIHGLPPSAEP